MMPLKSTILFAYLAAVAEAARSEAVGAVNGYVLSFQSANCQVRTNKVFIARGQLRRDAIHPSKKSA